MSQRRVAGLCFFLSGAVNTASFAQTQDAGLPGAGQAIVGREAFPADPRPVLPEAEAKQLADHYRRLEALSLKAIAPGSRKAQDLAIHDAIDVAAKALAICEQFQGTQTAAGRAWSAAGGQGEWWELVEARHWWNGWKRMKDVSPAGRIALGLAALMKPQFEAAEKEARWEDAIQISRSQKATLDTHLGPDHPYALEARLNEARMLNAADKYEEAKVLLEQLVPELAASLGTQHPKTLTGRHVLSSAFHWSGSPDRAAPLLEGVLRDRRLVLNLEHTQTLQAASDLARTLSSLKQHERAFRVAEELHVVCAKSLGDAHWRTLDAVRIKAWELMELNRGEDGLQALEQALSVAEKPRTLGYAKGVWRLIGTQASIYHSLSARSARDNDGYFERFMNARAESLQKQLQLASEFPGLAEPAELVAKRAAIADSLASAGQKQRARKELDSAMSGFAALPVQPDSRRIGLIADLGRAAMRVDDYLRAEEFLERAWSAIREAATSDSTDEVHAARVNATLVCVDLLKIRAMLGDIDQGLVDIEYWQSVVTQYSPSEREETEDLLWFQLGDSLRKAGWATKSMHVWRTRLEQLNDRSAIGEAVVSAKRGLISALEANDGYREAEDLCKELYIAAVAEHGEASSASVVALNSLAFIQNKAGKNILNIKNMRRVLELSEQIQMPASNVEIYRSNLSKALEDDGQYYEADLLLKVSLVNCKAVFGEWSKEAVQIHQGMADLLTKQGRFDEAIDLLKALKPTVEEQFGRHSLPYLSVLKSMRRAHLTATRYAEALKLNDNVVAISRGVFGPTSLVFDLNLAADICILGSDIPAGERYLSEAFDVAVTKLGPDDAMTLSVLKSRVELYLSLGDLERLGEFGPRYFEALSSRRQREGVLPTTTELDSFLLRLKIFNTGNAQRTEVVTQVLQHFQPLLERANAELGMGNPTFRLVKQELGEFFAARGEHEKATAMHREVVEWYEQRLGPKHKTTLQALNRLGLAQQDQGLLAQAVATHRECLNRASPDAFELQAIRQTLRWNLAFSLAKSGHTDEATALLVELRSAGSWNLEDVGRLAYLPLNERRKRWLQIHRNLGFCMRVTMTSPQGLETALDAAMQRKALLQDMAAIEWSTLRAAQDPATAKTLEGLAAAQQTLAQASNDKTVAPERLAELERRVRDAERSARLAAPSIGRLHEQLRQGVEGVIKALQPAEALVEFVRYFPIQRVSEPGSEVVFKESGQAEYMAFVLQTDSSQTNGYRLNAVSLGDSEAMDGLIARFRKYVDRPDPDHIYRPAALLNGDEANQRLGVPADFAAILEDLRSRVWDKIAPNLTNASRLYVAMDGALHDLPLEVLARRDAAGVLRYLIEWDGAPEITYLSSGRELLRWPRGTQEGPGVRQLVAFVDPEFGGRASAAAQQPSGNPPTGPNIIGLASRILGAEVALLSGGGEGDELPRISTDVGVPQQFFDGYLSGLRRLNFGSEPRPPEALLYSGLEASEATWRRVFAETSKPASRILVFTTHGLWMQPQGSAPAPGQRANAHEAPDPMLRAGLALAGYNNTHGHASNGAATNGEPKGSDAEGGGDGLLTAMEVASTDLRGVELVILTACQSGRGVPLPGEAAAGLRGGFSVAGARSTISALWSIPTVWSTDFTRNYLRELVESQAPDVNRGDSLRAFRTAQRDLLNNARDQARERGTASPGAGNTHPFWWAGFVYQGVPK